MRYFVVDAFTNAPFAGNPAGVCLISSWPENDLMQKIALENSLPETAFIRKGPKGWEIRWFTPSFEMDLCGHATLASGFVILNILEPEGQFVEFSSQSGPLEVKRVGERLALDFPSRPPVETDIHPKLEECLGVKVLSCNLARDLVVRVESEEAVRAMSPDFAMMADIARKIGCMGIIPTAEGEQCDFVSRFFDPLDAIIEDPVTGSAHCSLIPFWAAKLGKTELVARQLSRRQGTLYCRDLGERVEIAGDAILYLEGELKPF